VSRIVSTPTAAPNSAASIDIESIVRRVLMQLRETNRVEVATQVTASETPLFDQRVFSLEDVRGIDAGTQAITLASRTVITPAARDELRQRGIAFEKVSSGPASTHVRKTPAPGTRAIDLQRDGDVSDSLFAAVKNQVITRGVRLCNQASTVVVLSDRPATTAHLRTRPDACVVSINRVDDVPRFLVELSPNVFVLDVLHLHVVSLTNAIASIAKPTSSPFGTRPKITGAGGLS